jgi:hypothetical protein
VSALSSRATLNPFYILLSKILYGFDSYLTGNIYHLR